MNRLRLSYPIKSVRMPHVCGDEPTGDGGGSVTVQYAPRMWG